MGTARTPEGKRSFATRLMLYMFRSCKRSGFDGIEIGVKKKKEADAEMARTKVIIALVLIREFDPRRYRYLLRDVKRIMVWGHPGHLGSWYNACALCELSEKYVLDPETTPEVLAATIVHEAMHGRLFRWGIGYEEEKRERVEHICCKAMIAFARRLPLSKKAARKEIMSSARRQLERDPVIWTDRGQFESWISAMRESGDYAWLLKIVQSRVMAKRGWTGDSQKAG